MVDKSLQAIITASGRSFTSDISGSIAVALAPAAVIDFKEALRTALDVSSFDLRDVWWMSQCVQQFNSNGEVPMSPPSGVVQSWPQWRSDCSTLALDSVSRAFIATLPCFMDAHNSMGHAVHELTASQVCHCALGQPGFPDIGFSFLYAALVEHNQCVHNRCVQEVLSPIPNPCLDTDRGVLISGLGGSRDGAMGSADAHDSDHDGEAPAHHHDNSPDFANDYPAPDYGDFDDGLSHDEGFAAGNDSGSDSESKRHMVRATRRGGTAPLHLIQYQ
jgi:hypothetical protein